MATTVTNEESRQKALKLSKSNSIWPKKIRGGELQRNRGCDVGFKLEAIACPEDEELGGDEEPAADYAEEGTGEDGNFAQAILKQWLTLAL